MNAVLKAPSLFGRETLCGSELRGEIGPLLQAHWEEIAHYRDIPLAPEWSQYEAAERAGRLRIYTLRDERLMLVGYAVYFLPVHPHYSRTKFAIQDILYLDPSWRRGGTGARLLTFSESELKAEGVEVIQQHVKVKHDFSRLLEHMGYEQMDTVWVKRL